MLERRLIEGDRVYIDDTNMTYKIASIQYINGEIAFISVYYVDPTTEEERIIPVNPELIKPF